MGGLSNRIQYLLDTNTFNTASKDGRPSPAYGFISILYLKTMKDVWTLQTLLNLRTTALCASGLSTVTMRVEGGESGSDYNGEVLAGAHENENIGSSYAGLLEIDLSLDCHSREDVGL